MGQSIRQYTQKVAVGPLLQSPQVRGVLSPENTVR